MRLSIHLAYLVCFLFSLVLRIWVLIINPPKKDLAIFFHSPTFSDGYTRRFQVFFDFFEKDNISFQPFTYLTESQAREPIASGIRYKQYVLYQRIAWIRAFQIPKAIFFKTVIIQRNLFPIYPDYKNPIFEKILRKFNSKVILDIWDPIHIWNPKLTASTLKLVDKITVNNNSLKNALKKEFNAEKIFVWPIAVDLGFYQIRESKKHTVKGFKLFYTGSPDNVDRYLTPLVPVLERINDKLKIELIVIGAKAPVSQKLPITHHYWNNDQFPKLLKNADLGLYPNFQQKREKNFAVAGKVLDYLAAKVPIIGADQGLPDGVNSGDFLLVANNIEEWEPALNEAFKNYSEMEKKAEAGYKFVKENLLPEKMYQLLKEIIAA